MEITAKIRGITYNATLCKDLVQYDVSDLSRALSEPAFLCGLGNGHVMAISCWVSPKRTRSYPYARIYDTLGFGGRKVTIIPIVKDEGKDGDRDFLQWDTVALMGLLGVYVVPAFYSSAERNNKYPNKITNQKFDGTFIRTQLDKLKHYHSSANHWNLEQFENVPEIGRLAIEAYGNISTALGVEMHSSKGMQNWVNEAMLGREQFLAGSRLRARAAQQREIKTIQPKEMFSGEKGSITIEDQVGGLYHLTSDDSKLDDNKLALIESKHSQSSPLPSIDDIKDGLIKIALFCNLKDVRVDEIERNCQPTLRLSSDSTFETAGSRQAILDKLKSEALLNNFELDLSDLFSILSNNGDMHSERVDIDTALVRQLIAKQFPVWADLPIRPVEFGGWDNKTFHLGEHMTVRLPSGAAYAQQVEKEQRWLPKLAPLLPLPIPVPLAMGKPADGYPWHWSVYWWLNGETAAVERIADLCQFAKALAEFLIELQRIDATDGPPPGPHNFYRGGPLAIYDAETRQAITILNSKIDVNAVTEIWEAALVSTWQGSPVWLHGDVSVGNLLVENGKLNAVIDFGSSGIGDPACDLAIAWTFFEGESRNAFRTALTLDNATWARGRGWALWKALIIVAGISGADPQVIEKSRRVIDEILADHSPKE